MLDHVYHCVGYGCAERFYDAVMDALGVVKSAAARIGSAMASVPMLTIRQNLYRDPKGPAPQEAYARHWCFQGALANRGRRILGSRPGGRGSDDGAPGLRDSCAIRTATGSKPSAITRFDWIGHRKAKKRGVIAPRFSIFQPPLRVRSVRATTGPPS